MSSDRDGDAGERSDGGTGAGERSDGGTRAGEPAREWWWDVVTPDAAMDQYFLVDPAKIAQVVAAAAVRPDDRVMEMGAGVGTVAAALPPHGALTLVDADPMLAAVLERRFPEADVRSSDALRATDSCDVLLVNLPGFLSDRLLSELARRRFRTAVLALPEGVEPDGAKRVGRLEPEDFRPRAPEPSVLWRLDR